MKALRHMDWNSIKLAVCGGMTSSEASKRWNVSAAAIRKRASREQWPTPTALENKMRELRSKDVPQPKPETGKELVRVQSQPLELVQEDAVTPCHTVTVLDALRNFK
jgi:hypothetical protein